MCAATVLALLTSMSVGQAGGEGCSKDTDCKGDRICVAGACESPQRSQRPPVVTEGSRRLGAVADSMVGLHLDLGGVVFYGPALALEVGGNFAGYVELRAIGLGFMRWVIAGDTDGEHNSVGTTDYGLGAGFRYYLGQQANRQGLYVGAFGEYIDTSSIAKSKDPAYIYHTAEMLIAGSVGYRWVFAGGMTLGVGGALGFAHVLDKSAHYDGSSAPLPSDYTNTASDTVGALLTWELGFAL
jgi:hypothetical protein